MLLPRIERDDVPFYSCSVNGHAADAFLHSVRFDGNVIGDTPVTTGYAEVAEAGRMQGLTISPLSVG